MPAAARRVRTNSRGEATREHLLDCAVALLRERGYAALTIAGLCARAGAAPTSVYWHFGSKAGLMETVLDRISGGAVERIRAEVLRADRPGERLDRLIAGIRELVTTQPLGTLTGVAVVGEGRHVTKALLEVLRRARERELETIASDFAATLGGDRKAGETLALLAVACANYAALAWRMDADPGQVDRILDGLRDAMVRLGVPSG